jgi:hypothetical protein
MTRTGWIQEHGASTDTWRLGLDSVTYALIIQYAGTDQYCWQAVRGDFRLSGIASGRAAAMSRGEEHIGLPPEEFNRLVAVDLMDNLRKIERDILRVAPGMAVLPGYHAGYEDGASDIRRRIAAAIDPCDKDFNAKVSGAGTASAGLTGSAANGGNQA